MNLVPVFENTEKCSRNCSCSMILVFMCFLRIVFENIENMVLVLVFLFYEFSSRTVL